MRAAAEGRSESIKLLVENGRADWTLSAMGGLSAVTWAASKGHRDIVAMLKKYDELWAAAASEGEFYILFKKDDSEDAVHATL